MVFTTLQTDWCEILVSVQISKNIATIGVPGISKGELSNLTGAQIKHIDAKRMTLSGSLLQCNQCAAYTNCK